MTDKIIIDGVVVAECEFLENNEFDCLCLQISDRYEVQTGCKNKDCYYKQLKRTQNTLQEIKKYIAKICKEECGYVQKKRCPDCDCRYGAILDLITKAEEE